LRRWLWVWWVDGKRRCGDEESLSEGIMMEEIGGS